MMRARVPSASSPEQTPYAAADAAFAEATAYLASREAQQMSESELERELHRLGQELMDKLLQGHREQRNSPAEAADPVEGTDEVDVMERSQRRVPEGHPETTTCGTVQVARLTRSSVAPRRRSTSRPRRVRRRRHGVVLHIIVQRADAGTGDAGVRPPPVASA